MLRGFPGRNGGSGKEHRTKQGREHGRKGVRRAYGFVTTRLKVPAVNGAVLAVTVFSQIQVVLSCVLLAATIFWTCIKIAKGLKGFCWWLPVGLNHKPYEKQRSIERDETEQSNFANHATAIRHLVLTLFPFHPKPC